MSPKSVNIPHLGEGQINDFCRSLCLAVDFVPVVTHRVKARTMSDDAFNGLLGQGVLHQADKSMPQRVRRPGKTAFLFELILLFAHPALLARAPVHVTEYPFRVQAALFIPSDSIVQYAARRGPDRDDTTGIFILSVSDIAFRVDSPADDDLIIQHIIDLQAESFARTEPCQSHEAECRMIP